MDSYKAILVDILTTTGYPGDKEEYCARFIEANASIALANTIEQLSSEVQQQIIACNNDHELIKQLIPAEPLMRELEQVSQEGLTSLFNKLSVHMNNEEKQRIASLLSSATAAPVFF